MIDVTITMQVLPEKRWELLQTLDGLLSVKRQESGFISSRIGMDAVHEHRVTLVDRWESQAAADTALHSEYFAVLRGALQILTASAQINIVAVPNEQETELPSGSVNVSGKNSPPTSAWLLNEGVGKREGLDG